MPSLQYFYELYQHQAEQSFLVEQVVEVDVQAVVAVLV
jgi:hypothetical protein